VTQRIGSNRIANTSVTGLKVADNSIRGNNIVAGQITGNLIGVSSISSNHIADLSVTGNELGLSSVSSNNFTSNLQLNIVRVIESANISTIAATGNINISVSNNSVHYFTPNTTGNCTFNLRANSTTRLDDAIANGQAVTVAIMLTQGATQYFANVYIDGVLQTSNVKWMGNARPSYSASITNSIIDVYSLTTIKTGSNAYTILASNTIFGTG
jgi:hypothetical protein